MQNNLLIVHTCSWLRDLSDYENVFLHFSFQIINEKSPISLFQASMITNQAQLVSPVASRYECITGDLEPVYLAPFLDRIAHNTTLLPDKPVRCVQLTSKEKAFRSNAFTDSTR